MRVGSRNRIKLSSTSTHLLHECLHVAANIVEEHTFKKCSPFATVVEVHKFLFFGCIATNDTNTKITKLEIRRLQQNK